jgi:hypothetical protein
MDRDWLSLLPWLIPLLLAVLAWDAFWRLIASWHAARRGQLAWFVCINIFGTIGILPIIYLLLNGRSKACSGRAATR